MKTSEELKNIVSIGDLNQIKSLIGEIKALSTENQEDIVAGSVILKYNDIFKYFIENDLPINAKDSESKTPVLIHAIRNHDLELAKFMIANTVNIHDTDAYGNSALMEAVSERNNIEEIIPVLIANGADLDQKNDSGISPREYAENFDYDLPE